MKTNPAITDEHCLLHSDIDALTNRGTVTLEGLAKDEEGNEWSLSTFVTVKWRRTATGFGPCKCGGQMVASAPKHPHARVRCNRCGSQVFLSNWLRREEGQP